MCISPSREEEIRAHGAHAQRLISWSDAGTRADCQGTPYIRHESGRGPAWPDNVRRALALAYDRSVFGLVHVVIPSIEVGTPGCRSAIANLPKCEVEQFVPNARHPVSPYCLRRATRRGTLGGALGYGVQEPFPRVATFWKNHLAANDKVSARTDGGGSRATQNPGMWRP